MTPRRSPPRQVGARGDPYPAWLTALRGASGVYVLRDLARRPLYVGESHTGRLYQTITRHLQGWGRLKGHWIGLLGPQQHDPGTTYDRASVLVQAIRTPAALAVELQGRLIHRLRPRDNIVGAADLPF